MKGITELITIESNYRKQKEQVHTEAEQNRSILQEEYRKKIEAMEKELMQKDEIIKEKVKKQMDAMSGELDGEAKNGEFAKVEVKKIEDCIINALN